MAPELEHPRHTAYMPTTTGCIESSRKRFLVETRLVLHKKIEQLSKVKLSVEGTESLHEKSFQGNESITCFISAKIAHVEEMQGW